MTVYWGISAMSHDASLAIYDGHNIVYGSHSERYSRIKNDKNLHINQINEAILHYGQPDRIFFYENHILKRFRQLIAGQYNLLFKQTPGHYLRSLGVSAPVTAVTHHHSHAAYGYYTSNFDQADILVIDSIGEFDTLSIWQASAQKLTSVWRQRYPHSVGLWYSAMTQRLGLKPQEHEYILMGMAAYGDSNKFYQLVLDDFILHMPTINDPSVKFKLNLHRGCQNWRPDITTVSDYMDLAAAVQRIYKEIFDGILRWMTARSRHGNVVIVGGCALNCAANIDAYKYYDHVWIPPNPGDAGSSVGAILAHTKSHQVLSPYLGTDIVGEYPVKELIDDLLHFGIAAVASGRAEFGPRALGHRSILADPRGPTVKDRVNRIKRREEFRPFAPMVLQEHAADCFDLPTDDFTAPYMQYAIKCKRPNLYPGIVHVDNTSRIQTVGLNDSPGVRMLLEQWYKQTGCPILLNTSLNLKDEPLVNTEEDAQRWSKSNNLTVRISKCSNG